MTFEKDLFISYAHNDNDPLPPETQGWVSRFHASLEVMLERRLGHKARIWRDNKLSGNDIFSAEIVSQFPATAVLLSVLSPRYLESEWCTKELNEFCKAAERSGGLRLGNKGRVFKIFQTPVKDDSSLPDIARQMLGYEFFTLVEDKPVELDPTTYGPEVASKYNLKVAMLAWDIAQLIKQLESPSPSTSAGASKPTIYLAECSYDQSEARAALDSDLRLHGYNILPDQLLSRSEAEYKSQVEGLLQHCQLSIHVVGNGYGAVPDGPSQKSVVILQNERAIQRSRLSGLPRLIWLPDGTASELSQQQQFIDRLHNDAEAQFGADLITADLETFKGVVHANLQKLEKPAAKTEAAISSAAKLVYLICGERDRPATIRLRKFLKAQGCDVQIPLFEGDAATVRQANQDALSQCDAVIVFYGIGDEAWERTVENDLKKMKGYRGEKPVPVRYTCLAPPATPGKQELIELEERNLIVALQGYSDALFQPLLEDLQRA
jgi:hypothetical protein